jgi:hypothetical protein
MVSPGKLGYVLLAFDDCFGICVINNSHILSKGILWPWMVRLGLWSARPCMSQEILLMPAILYVITYQSNSQFSAIRLAISLPSPSIGFKSYFHFVIFDALNSENQSFFFLFNDFEIKLLIR